MPGDGTQALLERLRAAGVRPTVARIGILQVLEASVPRRLDADEVFRELIARGLSIGQGTVYRTLKGLAERGLVVHEWRNGLNGSKAVYGLRPGGAEACDARIVCGECGCATEMADPELQERLRQLAQRQGLDFAARTMMVVVVCSRCERNRQASSHAGHVVRIFNESMK